MKKYRVGIALEQGGYLTVEANSPEEAEEKAIDLIDEKGEEAIDEVTHRDFFCIGDTHEEV